MQDLLIVNSFAALLQGFAGCFTSPSASNFVTLMTGWVLDLRRHTITEVVRAAGAVGSKHICSFHRFFSRGRWATDEVGLMLAALVIARLAPSGIVRSAPNADKNLRKTMRAHARALSAHRGAAIAPSAWLDRAWH